MSKLSEDQLMSFLSDELQVPREELGAQVPLFSSGLIDSIKLMEMVTFIEKQCAIKVKASEVRLDNLDSIEKILRFAAKRSA